ncbi:hypothetical protein EGW08_022857 [Elysia chlorotica]|uniref:CAP-Gly domain-containing protein n=1 Tax=Elysia chlorotica TaxID=188477 RepID=A0A433SJT9_ELYCH|nr:hypothetical protein EGW08_022857 [Elysia chlorotica]
MVLFDNVFSGQRVEVKWNNGIYKGIVRYKGPVATKRGDWVGIALDHPGYHILFTGLTPSTVGDCAGMLFGRRYFQCRPSYGVFVRADKVRFIRTVRCLYDRYRKISSESLVDEHLFDTPSDPCFVFVYFHTLKDYSAPWDVAPKYSLRHSVGNRIPAATMLRAATTGSPFRYRSRPIHVDYLMDDEFENRPSVPFTHMPHSALREQVRRGWHGSHYVRQMTVPTGRELMKYSQWNDISP